MMGELSEAMIFAASEEIINDKGEMEETAVLLFPENDLPAGSKVF
jgi:tRNA-binding EMAP/Myf-like protein